MTAPHSTDGHPAEEYASRLEARRQAASSLDGRDRRIAGMRLVVAAIAVVVALAAYRSDSVSWGWTALPVVGFLVLVLLHDRVLRDRRRAGRAVEYYLACESRLSGAWVGLGRDGAEYVEDNHPYAADLDLFGEGSLFQRVNTARTAAGERYLARWLLEPADPAEIAERQEAVAELRERLDLREDLAVLGAEVFSEIHPEAVQRWAQQPPVLRGRGTRIALAALSMLTVAGLALWGAGFAGPLPAVVLLAVQGVVGLVFRRRVLLVLAAFERPEADLEILSGILSRLEREHFVSSRMVRLRAALDTDGRPPSWRIRHLARLVDLLRARRNQLFLPVSWVLLWGTQGAFAAEAWRARWGASVVGWLEAVGRIEALSSLAGYAFDHPGDPFPEVRDGSPRLAGDGLGHPLIPPDRCVRNSLDLGDDARMLIVSGSNMSGKSTLLRTVGINVVLAQAGAPVRATSLRMTPLMPGATLRIQDSLREGSSRFYAEITRLRQILDRTAGPGGVLFLLDEILHGTNSHDRVVGATAVLRTLVRRGAIGLVATHDLALADDLGGGAVNVHFEDRIEEGRMVFDYRLRPGVVRKSNALELMRSVGLEV